jgi:hypothetical protein
MNRTDKINMNTNKSYDIFISYRHEGGETMAILLHDRLTAKGYNVFLDVESLNSGKFNSQLLKVIENCKDVISVLSKNSLDRCVNEDDWVLMELSHAFKHGKNIIPFMLRGFEWTENLPEGIAELPLQNGVNAKHNEYFDASVERLITKFLESKPQKSAKRKWKPMIPVIAAFTAAGVIVSALLLTSRDEPPNIENPSNTSGIPDATAPVTTNSSEEDVIDKDFSDRVTNQIISASSHGIAALKSDGTVLSYDMSDDLSGWSDIVSVSVGVDHVLGLKSDGTVVSMGDNAFGQCSVASWNDVISIHAGHFTSFGITRNGRVLTAGLLSDYNLGILEVQDVIMIATGLHHVAALTADGRVEVFGRNTRGEEQTSGWSDIVSISADDFFTLGLKSDGSVVWAGQNIWCDSIKYWDNMKFITVGGGSPGDIAGIRQDGKAVVSTDGKTRGKEVIGEWYDIIAVAVNGCNIVAVKSDGTVVYTEKSRWDEISEELSDWSNLHV